MTKNMDNQTYANLYAKYAVEPMVFQLVATIGMYVVI